MGTRWTVKIAQPSVNPTQLAGIRQSIETTLQTINQQMSTYLPNSELSEFNRASSGEWFAVSPSVVEVVDAALAVSRETGGAFDVTIGPLIDLWRFGPASTDGSAESTATRIPTDAAITETRQRIGYDKLSVQVEPPALKKTIDELEVDLSAIAKGYAVDRVTAVLSASGLTDFMVEIGGEVRTKGSRPDGQPWKIGIEQPVAGVRRLHATVPLRNRALATSGDYRNFFEYQGQRYSHILDPTSGRPVKHNLVSASVLADSCMTADALATALLVMGPDEGYDWAERHQVAALLLTATTTGYNAKSTTAWQAAVAAAPD